MEAPKPDKCESDNCPHVATCVPKFMIPAKGYRLKDHKTLEMIFGLKLCGPCFKALKVQQWIGPEVAHLENNLRSVIEVLTARLAPPDYDRIWFEAVPLASGEYQTFLRMSKPADDVKVH